MDWNHENHIITDEMVKNVKSILKVDFPEDFLSIIKKTHHPEVFPLPMHNLRQTLHNILLLSCLYPSVYCIL